MVDQFVTPKNRTSIVWQYFGFPKGQKASDVSLYTSEQQEEMVSNIVSKDNASSASDVRVRDYLLTRC